MKPTILHIAIDYDNPHRGRPTDAIKIFIDQLTECDNVVFSMRRVANPARVMVSERSSVNGLTIFDFHYFGLPMGVGLFFSMYVAARMIGATLQARGVRPHVIHAHKLTFEGLSGWLLSRALERPLIISIRGEVERKIFRFKPTYLPLYRHICRGAHRLLFVSMWFKGDFRKYLGFIPMPLLSLPNKVGNATPQIVSRPPTREYVSVLNLNDWKRKGLGNLLSAIADLKQAGDDLALDIIGGGGAEKVNQVRRLIVRLKLGDCVRLIGRIPNEQLLSRIGDYKGILLPSRDETFGMVYAEALFSGVPVLMNKDSSLDGYLDGLEVAVMVPAGGRQALVQALSAMKRDHLRFRDNIMKHKSILFERLSADAAVKAYQEDVISQTSRAFGLNAK